jgi:phosphonoacetate hydrolase
MQLQPKECSFEVNRRRYRCPARPIAAICLDGSSDEYLNAAMVRGRMRNLSRISVQGTRAVARAAMPTFTNVNNSSIVTGVPPSVHGIGGNFFYDEQAGREVMMNSAAYLRAPTIFPEAAGAGRKVGVVTAKEKLRDIFAHGLIERGGFAFSSEKAAEARSETHGIADVETWVGEKTPAIYSGDASIYVLKAGVASLRSSRADFLYLSTTDFMQHTYTPEDQEALDFYAAIDREIGALLDGGALVGVTADHGMNPKQKADGSPNVVYLESFLKERFGADFRVILPITDPYVVHHGALGSFAVVHPPKTVSIEAVRSGLLGIPGVTEVWTREEAVVKLQLPEDRLGALVVCAGRDLTLGRTPAHHDLSVLRNRLRSHGGRYEEMVPFIFSHPLNGEYQEKLRCDPRNFDLFEYLTNGLVHE